MTNLASVRVFASVRHAQKSAFGVLDLKVFVCKWKEEHELSIAADGERRKGRRDGRWNVIPVTRHVVVPQDVHLIKRAR